MQFVRGQAIREVPGAPIEPAAKQLRELHARYAMVER